MVLRGSLGSGCWGAGRGPTPPPGALTSAPSQGCWAGRDDGRGTGPPTWGGWKPMFACLRPHTSQFPKGMHHHQLARQPHVQTLGFHSSRTRPRFIQRAWARHTTGRAGPRPWSPVPSLRTRLSSPGESERRGGPAHRIAAEGKNGVSRSPWGTPEGPNCCCGCTTIGPAPPLPSALPLPPRSEPHRLELSTPR